MLGDKVKTLLEATLEATVQKIASEVYEEKYGKPLKESVRCGRYEMERELLSHIQKTTKEILETNDEIRELIKTELKKVLTEAFTPKIKE